MSIDQAFGYAILWMIGLPLASLILGTAAMGLAELAEWITKWMFGREEE